MPRRRQGSFLAGIKCKKRYGCFQLLGLVGKLVGGRGHLFGRTGVLLDDLIELLDGHVDLFSAGILLFAGSADLLHQFGGSLDVGQHPAEHFTSLFGNGYAAGGEFADFAGGRLTPLGKFSNFGCNHRKAFSVFTGAGGFDCGVQCQQVGLAGNLFDDRDLGGDLFHGRDGFIDRLATFFGVGGGFYGDLFGLHGVVGILTNAGGHLFHAG